MSMKLSLRSDGCAILSVLAFMVGICLAENANAHFSYSDPRIIHMTAHENGQSVILVRMPAPLALLPDDWKGVEDKRVPPFGSVENGNTVLDPAAIADGEAVLRARLNESVELWIGGQRAETRVEAFRFWSDKARPTFGTVRSALAAFDAPFDRSAVVRASYFDLTIDVMVSVPAADLSEEVRLVSSLGHRFRVIDKLGTVVKLHRKDATETSATLGVMDVSFPKIVTKWEIFLGAALTGAEHIYRGLDHLAMIVLIAIAAPSWRRALIWASAFTIGHMTTLAAGLYGVAPASDWFVPTVELAIVLTIAVAGVAVITRRKNALGWVGLLVVGLIHGYGFAASASVALFAGQVDPLNLTAFALGLELCQFAIYALALPLILLLDRAYLPVRVHWRHAMALTIAISAGTAAIFRFSEASNAFGVV